MPIRALLPENPKIATSAPSSGAQLYAQIPLLAHLYSNHYEMLGMDGNRPPGKALDAPINGATTRLDDRPALSRLGPFAPLSLIWRAPQASCSVPFIR